MFQLAKIFCLAVAISFPAFPQNLADSQTAPDNLLRGCSDYGGGLLVWDKAENGKIEENPHRDDAIYKQYRHAQEMAKSSLRPKFTS
jgi:hypothetical protein